ncbi:MAG TPA: hypothetical protein ENK91_07870 [Bacteroidetes bacterium]|nr:hypothetical protein [Bacteroidota bacterium]
MNKLQFFILGFLLHFVLSCSSSTTTLYEKSEETKESVPSLPNNTPSPKLLENPYLIPENLFLENRVENCDSAIVFMKHIIKPGDKGWEGFMIRGESKKFLLHNKLVDKHFVVPNNQRFYISIDCLIGQDIQTVLDVFVKPKFHATLLKKYENNQKFVLYLKGLDSVSFYLIGQNRIINSAKYGYTHRVH